MDKCVDQTSGKSSGYIEHLQIWRANKQPSVFTQALESVVNWMSCTDSVEEHKEITAICTLRPVNTTATEPTDYNGSSPIFFRLSHLADHGVKFDSIDCNTETTNSSQPCINITKSTGNKRSTFEDLLKRGGWPLKVLVSLQMVFAFFFTYSPGFLCLFSPTEVTEDGVHQIVLDGASPLSLRSLMGNYFFSKEDTIWHRVRMFILRAVVLPFLFLGPVIFTEYVHLTFNIFGTIHPLHPFMVVSYVCYYITACYISFSSMGSPR